MRERLKGDQRLIDAIVPTDFPFGCRRPTPGNGYLEALLQPNVHTFSDGMLQTLTEKGFLDAQGVEHEVDVFVCATWVQAEDFARVLSDFEANFKLSGLLSGFNTSFVPRFPIIAHGVNVQDRWAKYPVDSYLSYAVKDTPNYLMYYGPHGPTGHGSGAPMIEARKSLAFNSIWPCEKIEIALKHKLPYQWPDASSRWSGKCKWKESKRWPSNRKLVTISTNIVNSTWRERLGQEIVVVGSNLDLKLVLSCE